MTGLFSESARQTIKEAAEIIKDPKRYSSRGVCVDENGAVVAPTSSAVARYDPTGALVKAANGGDITDALNLINAALKATPTLQFWTLGEVGMHQPYPLVLRLMEAVGNGELFDPSPDKPTRAKKDKI